MLSWSLVNRRSGKLLFCCDIIFTYKAVEFFKASVTSYLKEFRKKLAVKEVFLTAELYYGIVCP